MPQRVYDPRGRVNVRTRPLAPRVGRLEGLRLAVLDNTKWNAARLLDAAVAEFGETVRFGEIRRYKKETFSKAAAPELIREIAAHSDIALIAIAD